MFSSSLQDQLPWMFRNIRTTVAERCWSQIYLGCLTNRIKEGFRFRITRLAHCTRNELVTTRFFPVEWRDYMLPGTLLTTVELSCFCLTRHFTQTMKWSEPVKISGDEDTSAKVFLHLSGTKTKAICANLSGDQGGPPSTPASLKVTCFDTGFWNNVSPMWGSCARQNSTNSFFVLKWRWTRIVDKKNQATSKRVLSSTASFILKTGTQFCIEVSYDEGWMTIRKTGQITFQRFIEIFLQSGLSAALWRSPIISKVMVMIRP